MYPPGRNDSDELTYFLCFPEAPARWGISCVPLHLESILAGETAPGQKGITAFCIIFLSCNVFKNQRYKVSGNGHGETYLQI